jgi:hypothetical protein
MKNSAMEIPKVAVADLMKLLSMNESI